MRHPFDGIVRPGDADPPTGGGKATRREVLKRAASLGSGLAIAGLGGAALAQGNTTLAVGEEGGRPRPPRQMTTLAVGEEGAKGSAADALFRRESAAFEAALKRGDVCEAHKRLKQLYTLSRDKRYRVRVLDARKRFGAKLSELLAAAAADLKAGKLVEAVKACRVLTQMEGFPEKEKAAEKLREAAKLDGYDKALREVQAQELYEAAPTRDLTKRQAELRRIARDYKDTPTGTRAAEEAEKLGEQIKRQAEAAKLYGSARRTSDRDKRIELLRKVAEDYPDTPSGRRAAWEVRRLTSTRPPATGGRPGPTTLAIGEEG